MVWYVSFHDTFLPSARLFLTSSSEGAVLLQAVSLLPCAAPLAFHLMCYAFSKALLCCHASCRDACLQLSSVPKCQLTGCGFWARAVWAGYRYLQSLSFFRKATKRAPAPRAATTETNSSDWLAGTFYNKQSKPKAPAKAKSAGVKNVKAKAG